MLKCKLEKKRFSSCTLKCWTTDSSDINGPVAQPVTVWVWMCLCVQGCKNRDHVVNIRDDEKCDEETSAQIKVLNDLLLHRDAVCVSSTPLAEGWVSLCVRCAVCVYVCVLLLLHCGCWQVRGWSMFCRQGSRQRGSHWADFAPTERSWHCCKSVFLSVTSTLTTCHFSGSELYVPLFNQFSLLKNWSLQLVGLPSHFPPYNVLSCPLHLKENETDSSRMKMIYEMCCDLPSRGNRLSYQRMRRTPQGQRSLKMRWEMKRSRPKNKVRTYTGGLYWGAKSHRWTVNSVYKTLNHRTSTLFNM